MSRLQALAGYVTDHIWAFFAAVLSLIGAALFTYAREQIRTGTEWTLTPLTRALPWNSTRNDKVRERDDLHRLHSEFSLVDVFIFDASGERAVYRKISRYRVLGQELLTYQEGVTAEGRIDEFATMRGTILRTAAEHGFYVSTIALGEPFKQNFRFVNVYRAVLHHCFKRSQEHWTQELAFPTEALTLQIHFPFDRPPQSFTCEFIQGTEAAPTRSTAHLVDLFGNKSIVWDIERPKVGDIFKLAWFWYSRNRPGGNPQRVEPLGVTGQDRPRRCQPRCAGDPG